ncbi:hypothetical protein QAD02_016457 [Eretmocerus hayati]|uniref:Uncharacterized protein n=1 Tax=Eretmocerus hayati TaxID=131215 RepID=A0ACC2PFY7_9HYME|nr:hypothetical protein QAD02_016457 [Eretmocerus hayati]
MSKKENTSGKPASTRKYDVAHSDKLGRYMVAGKKLSAGELIVREDALAVGPASFVTDLMCFACMRPLPAYRKQSEKSQIVCSKCGVAPLCSRSCEESSATPQLHTSWECSAFRERRQSCSEHLNELSHVLLHLRLWLLQNAKPDAWEVISSMEAHLERRRKAPVWLDREANVVNAFARLGFEADSESLQRLCGIVDVNAFELRAPCASSGAKSVGPPILRGLFPGAALMSHSCRPTGHVAVDGEFRITIHAATPINVSEPVTFNYTSSLLGTVERQEHLQEGKYFRCECNTCKDPFEDGSYLSCIVCPRCRKDFVGLQNVRTKDPYNAKTKWQCRKCKRIFRGCLIRSTLEISKNMISCVDDDDVKALENLLEKLARTFHKNHFVMLSLKQQILGLYRNEIRNNVNPRRKVMQRMLEMCKEMLDVLEIVEPGISRLKGITLYEMHLPLAMLAQRAYSSREITATELLKRLEEAKALLKRGCGMLLLEPQGTPEAQLAKQALMELKLLNRSCDDARALACCGGCDCREADCHEPSTNSGDNCLSSSSNETNSSNKSGSRGRRRLRDRQEARAR